MSFRLSLAVPLTENATFNKVQCNFFLTRQRPDVRSADTQVCSSPICKVPVVLAKREAS